MHEGTPTATVRDRVLMPKSAETLMETETTIRWDETGKPATLWTASRHVRRAWQSYGFPIVKQGGGWRAEVPVDRISYKMVRK